MMMITIMFASHQKLRSWLHIFDPRTGNQVSKRRSITLCDRCCFQTFENYVFPLWKWIRCERSCGSISPREESGKRYWVDAKKALSRSNGKSCLPFSWNLKRRRVDNADSYSNVNGLDKDEDVQRGPQHFESFEWPWTANVATAEEATDEKSL